MEWIDALKKGTALRFVDAVEPRLTGAELGQRRAESVRRFLSREHKLPLNRMSTISYGDTLPLESNKTRAGRSANRRVGLPSRG